MGLGLDLSRRRKKRNMKLSHSEAEKRRQRRKRENSGKKINQLITAENVDEVPRMSTQQYHALAEMQRNIFYAAIALSNLKPKFTGSSEEKNMFALAEAETSTLNDSQIQEITQLNNFCLKEIASKQAELQLMQQTLQLRYQVLLALGVNLNFTTDFKEIQLLTNLNIYQINSEQYSTIIYLNKELLGEIGLEMTEDFFSIVVKNLNNKIKLIEVLNVSGEMSEQMQTARQLARMTFDDFLENTQIIEEIAALVKQLEKFINKNVGSSTMKKNQKKVKIGPVGLDGKPINGFDKDYLYAKK